MKEEEEIDLSNDALQRFHIQISEWLRLFRYNHLPSHLRPISRSFARLALEVASRPDVKDFAYVSQRQTIMSLEYLLIAKDAAVRAAVR